MQIKPNLVLLPGYDGDGQHSFQKLYSNLSDKYNITIIDYPYQDRPKQKYSLDSLTEYVKVYIDKYVRGKFHLLGFSLGGFVTIRYAQKYPERLQSITLLNSTAEPKINGAKKIWYKVAKLCVKKPYLAQKFALFYCSPILRTVMKFLPLPPLNGSLNPVAGFAIFGSLINILDDTMCEDYVRRLSTLKTERRALLFLDDKTLSAKSCQTSLIKYGFGVTINETGGHAVEKDYWDQVARYIRENI